MRVHFDGVDVLAPTGPNVFAGRLASELFMLGHEVVFDGGPNADVSLVFIEPSGALLAPKIVQRLDGIWSCPNDFHIKNTGIRALYDRADAVIFQSNFDQQMVTKWWEIPRLITCQVIHNGIDLKPIKEITIPKLIELRGTYDKIYVCSSNWHPQKRLEANVALFEHLRRHGTNSCLIVLGNNADMRLGSDPHIFFAGSVNSHTYLQIYAAADWMLHLEYGGHCPNVVIEALSQGTPVARSEVGGTKELVGGYGGVFKERAAYDFSLYDYDNPPGIDVTQHGELPTRQQLDHSSIADIDITHVAQRYVEVFKQACQ